MISFFVRAFLLAGIIVIFGSFVALAGVLMFLVFFWSPM